MMNVMYSEILNILGLDIKNGRVFDTDTNQYLIFNGNYIFTEDSIIIHKKDTVFDLLTNVKLVNYFLNVLIQKETEENGLYVQILATCEDPTGTPPYIKRSIMAKTNKGDYQSNHFYNFCLAYIHMIYIISGTPINIQNLRDIDYTKEQLQTMFDMRKNK